MRDDLVCRCSSTRKKATAREIARVLRFPSAIKREQFCRQRFELIEYRLADDNPLVGLQLSDLYRNIRVKILICAVARGSETIIPTGMFTLRAGDKDLPDGLGPRSGILLPQAEPLQSKGQQRDDRRRKPDDLLPRQGAAGHPEAGDRHRQRCGPLPGDERKFPGVLVIHGDGADSELLSEERISDMDAFVPLTGLDETNIILAMYASQMNSCKVVAKINRNSFAELAAAKGMVDSVVSTASVTSESIAMYVRAMQNSFESENIKTLHRLVGRARGGAGIQRCAGFAVHRRTAERFDPAQGLLVAGIVRRNGQPVIPSGNDALQEGDDVVIVTTDTTLHSLRDIVKVRTQP